MATAKSRIGRILYDLCSGVTHLTDSIILPIVSVTAHQWCYWCVLCTTIFKDEIGRYGASHLCRISCRFPWTHRLSDAWVTWVKRTPVDNTYASAITPGGLDFWSPCVIFYIYGDHGEGV